MHQGLSGAKGDKGMKGNMGLKGEKGMKVSYLNDMYTNMCNIYRVAMEVLVILVCLVSEDLQENK